MAINDAATLAIDSGNFFTAPIGTPLPADLTKIGSPWEAIGNTALDDVLGMKSDGGDSTVLGTLQNKNLRTRRSNRTETMTVKLQQFDKAALKLFFGANAKELADGTISVPSQPTPTRVAFLAVFVDGSNIFAMYAPLAEILRGDDMDIKDTESLVSLPLNVTPLNYNNNDWPYSVTPLGTSTGSGGAAAWKATTAYTVGTNVTNNGATLQVTTAGTSGSTAPTNPAVNATVTDGSVVWKRTA